MTWNKHILVVANVTATSDELERALKQRAAREQVQFTLLVPATPFGGGRGVAQKQCEQACERLRAGGLRIEGLVGDGDPVVAVAETWDPRRHDEIILVTLPMRFSKWLHAGLPERVSRLTGAPVTHVISEPHVEPEVVPAPTRGRPAMGPLAVLGWGSRHEAG
jgi:GABA permease